MMGQTIRPTVAIIVLAVILGIGRNTVAPGGIPWVGQWGVPVEADGDTIIRPPSAMADDPPFLTFAQAEAKYGRPDVIFVDARYPEDYAQGHIRGAVLFPFEMFDDYWPGVQEQLPRDREIVTYCSGADCELSLFLARALREEGYANVSIFFGGVPMWKDKGMPMDTGAAVTSGS